MAQNYSKLKIQLLSLVMVPSNFSGSLIFRFVGISGGGAEMEVVFSDPDRERKLISRF